jgi:hypothetical protein
MIFTLNVVIFQNPFILGISDFVDKLHMELNELQINY